MKTVLKEEKSKSYKEFEKSLAEDLGSRKLITGEVVTGIVEDIGRKYVLIDVGGKSSGAVPVDEFKRANEFQNLTKGSKIKVFLSSLENRSGEIVISFEQARKAKAWGKMKRAYENKEDVVGTIVGRIRGGFAVSVDSCMCFLPSSQLSNRPIKDLNSLMKTPQTFECVKLDERRGNVVLSRKSVIERAQNKDKKKIIEKLKVGDVVEGTVKSIVDWGLFVDLAGIDSLCHITELAWSRVSNPGDLVSVGQKISTKIIKIEHDKLKVHVSLKRLTPDPYSDLIDKFEIGKTYDATVTKVQEYGAFASLAPGLEGLIHSSKISYSKRNLHPGKTLSTSQKIKVVLLEKDLEKRRLSLSYKDTFENPYKKFSKEHKIGSIVSGVVKSRVDYGLFITIDGTELDGLCHINDVDFENQESEIEKYKKGQKIKALKILEINIEDEKIRLSLKVEKDDFEFFLDRKIGDIITGTVASTTPGGIYIQVGSKKNLKILIKKNNLAIEPENQRPARWTRGDSCDSVITHLDKAARSVKLSIKKLEEIQSAEAIKRYGSKDSGGVLADLFDFTKVKTKKPKSKK